MCTIQKYYVIVTCTGVSVYEGVVCWTD